MKHVCLWVLIVLMVSTLAACSKGGPSNNSTTKAPDTPTEDASAVDDKTLETLSQILDSLEDAFKDWEGKQMVNAIRIENPFSPNETVALETRVQTDSDGDRLYAEVLDTSRAGHPKTLQYIYLEDEVVYIFKSADSTPGETLEDTYTRQDRSEMEGNLPDIESMFSQILQFFPANRSNAEMQGMTLLDAALDYDDKRQVYQADVRVSMQTTNGMEREGVWSIEGTMKKTTIEMPIPTLGTVTFEERRFEDTVDPIDTSLHSEKKDDDSE